jgi:hypothetical protein
MAEIKLFKNQDYALLKNQHNASNLFVDLEFPANVNSLFHSRKVPKVSRKISNCTAFSYHSSIDLYYPKKLLKIHNLLGVVLTEAIYIKEVLATVGSLLPVVSFSHISGRFPSSIVCANDIVLKRN